MDTNNDPDKLQAQIKLLRALYLVLLFSSMAILVAQTKVGFGTETTVAWALTLGGAVVVRLRRSALMRRYDELVWGRP
jgi:hypothetical protein